MKIYVELNELMQLNEYKNVKVENLAYVLNKQSLYDLEIIYSLILHHYFLKNSSLTASTIPYNGKIYNNGRGVVFIVDNLPDDLVKIISLYTLFKKT